MKVYAVVQTYNDSCNSWENILELYQLESDANTERDKQYSESNDPRDTFYVQEMKVL